VTDNGDRGTPSIIVPGLVVVGAGRASLKAKLIICNLGNSWKIKGLTWNYVLLVSGVVVYIRSQLRHESDTLNRMFSQQNTPEVRAKRDRSLLVETEGNPRKTVYNVLNW
jgi:hypothetical protein